MTVEPITCDQCRQPIDVAQPHITVVSQFEVQYETGVVTVLDSPVLISQRHPLCHTEDTR